MDISPLTESEVMLRQEEAFASGQFVPYYQPQYNHSTGLITGAEALARWISPDRGLIPPNQFIPVFEKNDLVTKLDLSIFESVCRFIRNQMDDPDATTPPPISVNVARNDLYQEDFIDRVEEIRKKYLIPVESLRFEITETSAIGGLEHINKMISQLHSIGYLVEMDDFGSGYSSLNMLKNVEIDVLKLDMDFLDKDAFATGRGGAILSSVVRMARLLGLPVIAEGVETREQADYLRGIGCDIIQGYYYSRPLPEKDFCAHLKKDTAEPQDQLQRPDQVVDTSRFLDPNSVETMIFSKFMGPAVLFSYSDGKLEAIRVNRKYIDELGMNMTFSDAFKLDIFASMDEAGMQSYLDALKRAVRTGEEQVCETRRFIESDCCGTETLYVRSEIKLIGKSRDGRDYLFYIMVRNITAEKNRLLELGNYEHSFRQVTEQVNIYFWEYTVATKEMRPCFRCMRDLGLPPVVKNYPEPAFEAGIFPMDYADMYRDWHRQIAEGVPELEAIIPLTVGRVPFRVKYVTEFDDLGRPIKAYGSATYIQPDELEKLSH